LSVGNTINIYLTSDIDSISGGGSYQYSKNSTSSWTTFRSFGGPGGTVGYTINPSGDIGYSDIIRVQVDIGKAPFTGASGTITLTGGTMISGSGTVTATGGTTVWNWSG
jgi:hypothetical protein